MKILFTIFLSAVASVCIYATDIKDDKYTTIDDYNGNALTDSNGNPLIRINLLDGAGNDLTLTIDNNYPNKGTVKEIGSGSNPLVSSKEYAERYTSVLINAIEVTAINANAFKGFTNVTSFEIKTTTPPTIAENTFPAEWKESCNLIVPGAAIDGYKNSDWANYFYSINGEVINREEGTSEIGTGTPNNIANIKNTSITISGKNIILGAITEVKVYSITGEQIYNGVTNKVNVLNNGIYIVKTANTTQRVIVK